MVRYSIYYCWMVHLYLGQILLKFMVELKTNFDGKRKWKHWVVILVGDQERDPNRAGHSYPGASFDIRHQDSLTRIPAMSTKLLY